VDTWERREVALMIVSTGAVSAKDFMKYAQGLVRHQKPDRIVIDECHLTVTAVEYRPTMVDVTTIRCLRTQFHLHDCHTAPVDTSRI
jgi:hypothetical protein